MRSISLIILVAVSLCAAIWPANASLQCYECIGHDCEDWDKVPLVDCDLNEPETTTPEDVISTTTENSSPGSESTGATGSTESTVSTESTETTGATKTTDAAETTEGTTTTAESDATTTDAAETTEGSTTTAESEATTTDATDASTTTDASTEHATSEAPEATTDASTDITETSSTETTPIATTDAESTAITQESSSTEETSRPTEDTTESKHTAATEESTTESSSATESTSESAGKATTEPAAKGSLVHAQLQQMTLPAAGVRSGLARRTLAAQAADHLIRKYRALEQGVKYRTTACYSIVKDGTLYRGCVRIPEEQSACQAVREQVGLPENSVGDLCDVCQMDGCNGSASLRISLASLLLLLGLGLRGLL